MYVFEDRGGELLALRPENTAGVGRAYIEHGMKSQAQPVRLWYFGSFFRYDRPQAGRYRQLTQFGIEAIGSKKDILLVISTSGNSKNILEVLKCAKKKGITSIGFLGNKGGVAKKYCDQILQIHYSHF